MGKLFSSGIRRAESLARPLRNSRAAPYLILFMLFFGVVLGSVVGSFSQHRPELELEAYAASEFFSPSFPAALLHASRFFFLLLLGATSYLGVFVTPAVVFLRGYLLSCSVSAMYARFSFRGLGMALLLCGIPAIVIVPCFIFAACDAWSASQRLLSLRFDLGLAVSGRLLRCVPLIAAAVLLDAVYSFHLLPLLFSLY